MVSSEVPTPTERFYRYRAVGIAGSAILMIGSFCPAILTKGVPTILTGSNAAISYFSSGTGDGVLTAVIAAYCAALVLTLKPRWATGWAIISLPMIVFDAFDTHHRINNLNGNTGNASEFALGWCWYVLIGGIVLVGLSWLLFDGTHRDSRKIATVREWGAVWATLVALTVAAGWGASQERGAALWISLAFVATLVLFYRKATAGVFP